jgi:hypothetical protein
MADVLDEHGRSACTMKRPVSEAYEGKQIVEVNVPSGWRLRGHRSYIVT